MRELWINARMMTSKGPGQLYALPLSITIDIMLHMLLDCLAEIAASVMVPTKFILLADLVAISSCSLEA